MSITRYTASEFLDVFTAWFSGGVEVNEEVLAAALAQNIERFNRMLTRGDGIAVYQNQDLSHYDVGNKRFVSYGSPDAFFEPEYCDENGDPPIKHPDTPTEILWRYQLIGTYKGDALEL